MLTPDQHAWFARHIWHSDQDFFYWSNLRGEPFLETELLYLFDGHTLSLVGYPLAEDRPTESLHQALQEVLAECVKRFSPSFVNYYGPVAPRFDRILAPSYSHYYSFGPTAFNVDVSLDLGDPSTLRSRSAKEALRRLRSGVLEVCYTERAILSTSHISLLQVQCAAGSKDVHDVGGILAGLTLMRSPTAHFIEACRGGQLAAFAIVHEFFAGRPFIVTAAGNRAVRGAMDAVYATLIAHYQQQGAERLNLGYAIDAGLLHYKTKWGATFLSQPVIQRIWRREPTNISDCLYWPCLPLERAWQINNVAPPPSGPDVSGT